MSDRASNEKKAEIEGCDAFTKEKKEKKCCVNCFEQ